MSANHIWMLAKCTRQNPAAQWLQNDKLHNMLWWVNDFKLTVVQLQFGTKRLDLAGEFRHFEGSAQGKGDMYFQATEGIKFTSKRTSV